MKRACDGSPPRREQTYAGAGVSPEVKLHTARIAVALQARGFPVTAFLEVLQETEYAPAERTLREHMAAVKEGESPLSTEKESGRPPALDDEHWAIICGWILSLTKPVSLEDVQRWIKANMGTDVSIATVSRHKDEMGLSFQLTGSRGMKKGLSRDDYVTGYFDFVLRLHDEGFFEYDRRRIICIDFVTNSMRIERQRTLSLIGGKQKKLEKSDASYTNSYIVGVSLEGGPDLLSLMFTYDPTFDPKGPRAREVQSWCDANKIRRTQIYYEKSTRKYCKESQAQVIEFERRNRATLSGARVLHDQGGAFKKDGEYLLAERADRVVPLPAEQHGELSVLDNKLNAVAKLKWRSDRHNGDHSWDGFQLLVHLDRVGQDSITSWWTYNFLLDVPRITRTAVEARLGEVKGRRPIRQDKADLYADQYAMWLEEHDEVELVYEGDVPEGGLDGDYWKLKPPCE